MKPFAIVRWCGGGRGCSPTTWGLRRLDVRHGRRCLGSTAKRNFSRCGWHHSQMISKWTKWQAAQHRWALLIATLQQWPWMQTIHTLRQRFREDRLGLTAGSLTFTTTVHWCPGHRDAGCSAHFGVFPVFRRLWSRSSLRRGCPMRCQASAVVNGQFTGKASQLGGWAWWPWA